MTDTNPQSSSRRHFLGNMALGGSAALTGLAAGCAKQDEQANAGGADGQKPLKAAFSNAGLQSTWCALGKQTAELWGKLLNVEIEWFDGEFDPEKQRNKIDQIVDRDWDFCCFQAVAIDALAPPTEILRDRGIPVISMDTLLVPMDKMRETGVWTQVSPDHIFMAESSTKHLVDKIGGKGKVIHIGGLSAHSGAQDRKTGFENVASQHSDIEVLGGGVVWCDWKKEMARNQFEALLEQEQEPIAGAFFHSDDMALACVSAIENTIHKDMVITAVDGQKEGLHAVRDGQLAGTTVNPVCRIHRTALTLGQFYVRNNEKMDEVPLEVITPGPLVTQETGNLETMLYLAAPAHCLV
ncbi:sugar ABC transporter substrate-binding protein [Symmachiella dynata]|uniref:sugar ABC transporter substrate-binding protein n=1 Tax=Symmachiella dynata TaxID=2527995 RepID=UPI0030EE9FA0